MAKLTIEAGRGQGKTVAFEKQAIIGRAETATLQIGDVKASREHCKVFDQGGNWIVADLNSRNGIKVNGIVTTRKNLSAGDRIEVGETVIVFDPAGAPAAASPAVPEAPDESPPEASEPEKAAAPAARGPSTSSRSDLAAKKAAAMAEARASVSQDVSTRAAARHAAATAKSATKDQEKGLQVSDRVLQYNRIDPKKATLLDVDMAQSPALVKLGIWLGCLAFLGILAWAVSQMM